jgi:tetratricopeptide (TPR) repeat protein
MGDDREAESLHEMVLELLPGDITSLQTLAICLRRQRKNIESLAVYRELIEATPHNARAYRDAGSLLAYELGRKAEGVAFWKQALALDPTLPQADAMRREMRRWGGDGE